MEKNGKTKIITAVLLVIFGLVFIVSVGHIGFKLMSERRSAKKFDELTKIVRTIESESEEQTASAGERITEPDTVLPAYEPLYEKNSDLFGWLKIDDTPIDYPVMHTPDEPERYLRRDFDKKYSLEGIPFLDGKCPPDGNYFIVYGHNMDNETMFGSLPYYEDKEYRDGHSIIYFDTLYEKREYEVFAAFYSKVYDSSDQTSFKYYLYFDLSDPEKFSEFVRGVEAEAIYPTGINVEYGDELLTLSTCNYHTDNGRFVVVAKRIK